MTPADARERALGADDTRRDAPERALGADDTRRDARERTRARPHSVCHASARSSSVPAPAAKSTGASDHEVVSPSG